MRIFVATPHVYTTGCVQTSEMDSCAHVVTGFMVNYVSVRNNPFVGMMFRTFICNIKLLCHASCTYRLIRKSF